MKRFILSIIAMAMMSVFSVNAQTVKPSVEDFEACKAYLNANPTEKIVETVKIVCTQAGEIGGEQFAVGDTLMVTTTVFVNEDGLVARHRAYKKGVVVEVEDSTLLRAYDAKCIETQFNEELHSGRRRDVYYYHGRGVLTDGNAVKKSANKDGWSVIAEGSYQLADGCNSFSGKGGVSYTGTWWMVDLLGGPVRTIYSSNANKSGQNYTALAVQSGVYVQPIKFGKYDTDRLFFGGGVGFEHFKTDSKMWIGDDGSTRTLDSEGNYGYLHAGVVFDHRFFATGHSLYLRAEWRQKKQILQNADNKIQSAFEFGVGFRFGIHRKVVKNK